MMATLAFNEQQCLRTNRLIFLNPVKAGIFCEDSKRLLATKHISVRVNKHPRNIYQQIISDREGPSTVAPTVDLSMLGGKQNLQPNSCQRRQKSSKHLPVYRQHFSFRTTLAEHILILLHQLKLINVKRETKTL